VLTWPWLSWRLAGRIPRSAFRPVPAVDAGILTLHRRAEPLLPAASRAAWERAVTLGFGGVGGSLHASLRPLYPRARLDTALAAAGVGPREVVAFVPPEAWLALFTALERPPGRRR
jgi:23S rRNA (adenine-N6)-dimethyltransferase